MEELARKECIVGTKDMEQLTELERKALLARLSGGWLTPHGGKRLLKHFSFANFVQALAFVNRVGALAEQQNHHPDLQLRWGEVVVEIWTHTVGGLTESDFVFAAKTEAIAA